MNQESEVRVLAVTQCSDVCSVWKWVRACMSAHAPTNMRAWCNSDLGGTSLELVGLVDCVCSCDMTKCSLRRGTQWLDFGTACMRASGCVHAWQLMRACLSLLALSLTARSHSFEQQASRAMLRGSSALKMRAPGSSRNTRSAGSSSASTSTTL